MRTQSTFYCNVLQFCVAGMVFIFCLLLMFVKFIMHFYLIVFESGHAFCHDFFMIGQMVHINSCYLKIKKKIKEIFFPLAPSNLYKRLDCLTSESFTCNEEFFNRIIPKTLS